MNGLQVYACHDRNEILIALQFYPNIIVVPNETLKELAIRAADRMKVKVDIQVDQSLNDD